jgi:glycolate oxidase iron-sulfur subunit
MQTRFSPAQLADPAMATSEQVIRKCVHCGFCLATCPTYVLLGDELDSPRGRIYLMKDMLENERVPSPEVVKHVDRCLSCLSCMTTCPSGVNYKHLVDHARAYIEARHRRPWFERMLRVMLAATLPYPRRFRAALSLARLVRPLTPLARGVSPQIGAMLDLAGDKAATPARTDPPPAATPSRGRIALLQGCAEPVLRPQIQAAAERLLARAGFEVVRVAGEACCGALTHHMGKQNRALEFARNNVDVWSREIEAKGLDFIVVTASGCGTPIKDYGFLLRGDPAYATRAATVSAKVRDVGEFFGEVGLPPVVAPSGLAVAYQSACSLQHGQGVRQTVQRLLRQAGFEVREPAEAHLCCGSAGTYNILQPAIAGQLRDRKLEALEKTGAAVIAGGNIGCLTHLAVTARQPTLHTVELLDWACGGPKPAGLATN